MSDAAILSISPVRRLHAVLLQRAARVVARWSVQAELSAMDDRSLADLGISRADIRSIARAHAASI